jgi:PKD repeat protein
MYVFGSSYTSLAAMRNATGQEQHGVQANPNFANASSSNFQLTEGSDAIDSADSGVSGEQPTDILGTARSDDPLVANTGTGPQAFHDMGAYEFVSSGTPVPPTAALTVTPANGAAPLAVTADASASSDPQGQTLSYTFDFGDGTTVGPQAGATATHTYTTAGVYTANVTVTDTANLTGTAQKTVTVTASASNPAFVAQIATNYSTTSHTSGNVTVWRTQGVVAGDVEILTVQLTGAGTTGSFSGIDDKGNTLSVAEDISNGSGGRFAILYGVVHTALGVNDKITITFPGAAASYRIVGDEVSGVSTVDKAVGAAGTSAAYSSGATGTTSSPNEFVFGAVGVFSGSTPSWSTGWTTETTYAVGTNFVGRVYKIATSTGSFTASGTASGSWLAACVTFQ